MCVYVCAGWLSDTIKMKTASALQGLADEGCKAFLLLTVGSDQKSVVSLGNELGLTGTDYLWLGREMHTTFEEAGIAFPRAGVLTCLQVCCRSHVSTEGVCPLAHTALL
jgi:hypothetical protein